MNDTYAKRYLFLDGFWLKVLAFLTMTLDHLGVFLSMKGIDARFFRGIGRLAFPLFVFLLAEGMRLSHRKGRYVIRLLIAYLIITIPETIMVYVPSLADSLHVSASTLDPHPFADILFLGLTLFCLNLKGAKKLLALLPASFFVATLLVSTLDPSASYFPYYLRSGYGLFGLLLALAYFGFNVAIDRFVPNLPRLQRNAGNAFALCVAYALCFLFILPLPWQSMFGGGWMAWEIYALGTGILLLFYNGKRGYDATWWRVFSYGYFLLHMAVLYAIFSLI